MGAPTPAGTTSREVLGLDEVDRTQGDLVGGKGAQLGELSQLAGVAVPPGFCVTTEAFRRVTEGAVAFDEALDRVARLDPDDRDAIRSGSEALRRTIEGLVVPDALAASIADAVAVLGEDVACAVRSSATAEDLPTASFAGQQDTYLNVVGVEAIVDHVRRCWASLFTERAVTYRRRNGIDDRRVRMAVVVQRLVVPHASGVLFTADPVSGDRTVAAVEATLGLGEALVSGRVSPDAYRVRGDAIVDRTVAVKALAVDAVEGGGTRERMLDPEEGSRPVLGDEEVVALVRLGRVIEAHLGRPQDIEWCRDDDGFHVVQSRPITTLFPIPAAGDDERHVYVSVGHQQMMTDPMKPLGIDLWQRMARPVMREAAGRLFVEVTAGLASPATRAGLLQALGQSDPLLGDALQTLVDRHGFLPEAPDDAAAPPAPPPGVVPVGDQLAADPAIVAGLIEATETSIAATERALAGRSGVDLVDAVLADIAELKRVLFDPESHQAIMAGMEATWWLQDHLGEWLGERGVVDTLTQSVPHNVTSEMGLALLAVADAVRPHPEVVAFLDQADDEGFLDRLPEVSGGGGAHDAIVAFLDRYGMRSVGEIDLTRPRWAERPDTLLPAILANVRAFEAGEAERRFDRGRREAAAATEDVLSRLRALPNGAEKATEAARMIERVRTFAGFREYPKYGIVCRSFRYKRALWAETERLVEAGVLREVDDVSFLTMVELRDVLATGHADLELIDRRREAFAAYGSLTPPRVLTSDGEALTGAYRRDDVPAGALAGLAVSTGTVEGRARVLHDIADADLEAGDILVTPFTDPSWTPLFVGIAGLVTEVGGLMTHGAVIAREYGLPAVVGVEHATTLIRDGQRIRVHGTDGYVELL